MRGFSKMPRLTNRTFYGVFEVPDLLFHYSLAPSGEKGFWGIVLGGSGQEQDLEFFFKDAVLESSHKKVKNLLKMPNIF